MAFRHLHSQDLVHSNGPYSTTITFTDTQGTSSTDPIDSDDIAMQDAESGQAGGVSDELASHISLDYESSDDDLVQNTLDEMKETKSGFRKETISHLPTFNRLEDKQTLRPPLPTELTVDPPADEPQTTSHAEDALPNADESDESTGQVELQAFKTKITGVNPD